MVLINTDMHRLICDVNVHSLIIHTCLEHAIQLSLVHRHLQAQESELSRHKLDKGI